MLRQVLIFMGGQKIYQAQFGKALDDESFNSVMKKIQTDAFSKSGDEIQSHDFYKYRLSFIADKEKGIIFLFVTDLSDKFETIKSELTTCKREFLDLFGDMLDASQTFDEQTFEVFNPTVERIHKNLRPKIALVGFSGVGKTTITRLIRAEEIPMEHVPTITGEIATIKIGKLNFHLWDFAGQEQFSFLWNKFVKGSDAAILITDSTIENCEKSRFFLELIKQEAPYAKVAVIGNKQDLPDALPIPEIERMLDGVHAYAMVATDPNNRDKMITIIADILEMSAEVSPLLKPLIDRDKKIEAAENALISGNFQDAYHLFNEIGDLCMELGDDSIAHDFFEKAEKVRTILGETPQPPTGEETTEEQQEASDAPPAVKPPTLAPPGATPPAVKPPTLAPPGATPPAVKPPTLAPPGAAPPKLSVDSGFAKPIGQTNFAVGQAGTKPASGQPGYNSTAGQGVPAQPFVPPAMQGAGSTPPPTQQAAPATPPVTAPPSNAFAAAAPSASATQAQDIQSTVMDLKIKLANINKVLLDLELQNISGTLSDEDYEAKATRLEAMKGSIEGQIQELSGMLSSLN
ncbi:MAG: ADP-ribosylation factor-like protein [Promethearchaeota archaeon]